MLFIRPGILSTQKWDQYQCRFLWRKLPPRIVITVQISFVKQLIFFFNSLFPQGAAASQLLLLPNFETHTFYKHNFFPKLLAKTTFIFVLFSVPLNLVHDHPISLTFIRISWSRSILYFCFFSPNHFHPKHLSPLPYAINRFYCVFYSSLLEAPCRNWLLLLKQNYALAAWSFGQLHITSSFESFVS